MEKQRYNPLPGWMRPRFIRLAFVFQAAQVGPLAPITPTGGVPNRAGAAVFCQSQRSKAHNGDYGKACIPRTCNRINALTSIPCKLCAVPMPT